MSSKFRKGQGCYNCRICGRKTRDTGDQAIGSELCPHCWEMGGEENSFQDGYLSEEELREKLWPMVRECVAKGGDRDSILKSLMIEMGDDPCEATSSGVESPLPPSSPQSPLQAGLENREAWLNELMNRLVYYMEEIEPGSCDKIADWRVSCGWPYASRKAIGQCWSASASKNGKVEMFISPALDLPSDVDHVLLHEMVHASVAVKGHGGPFSKLAKKLGMTGKMTATVAGPELRKRLDEIVAGMPPYPHNALSPGDFGRKTQTTRMVKCRCDECGYILRTTQKWLDKGVPFCYCGGNFELASGGE